MLAATIAGRLGLSAEDVKRVEFLVREHLTMGHTSQRRDLDDPELIAHFARLCEDEETLRDLFLITFVDLYCVGPGNLTSWKDELLRDLFQRTRVYLRRGPDLLTAERAQAARRRKREACKKLSLSPDDPRVVAILGGLPDRYFVENSATQVARHVQLMSGRRRVLRPGRHPPAGQELRRAGGGGRRRARLAGQDHRRAVRQQAGHHGRRHLLAGAVRRADHRRGAGHLPGAAGDRAGRHRRRPHREHPPRSAGGAGGEGGGRFAGDLAGGVDLVASSPGPSPRCRPPR